MRDIGGLTATYSRLGGASANTFVTRPQPLTTAVGDDIDDSLTHLGATTYAFASAVNIRE